MAKRGEAEVMPYQKVLRECYPWLVKKLEVNRLMDFIIKKDFIDYVQICDIKEQITTSEKIRMLIDCLLKMNKSSYKKFKDCLEESGQSFLKKKLEEEERKQNEEKYILSDSDDASTSWDRSSDVKTNSVSQMKSSTRPVDNISSLYKGCTNWKLSVRVISKSKIIRTKKMDGRYFRIIKYFSVFFRDKSGQIRGVFFKDSLRKFKQFYNLLKVNKVFYVSGASVTEANPLYHRAHLELKMNSKTSIEPCRVAVDIPIIGEYCFTTINSLRYTEKGEFIDVIGIVDSIEEIETISTEYKTEETKRELNLVDQSGMVVSVTFWGQDVCDLSVRQNTIIALLGVKVSDWKGRSLSKQASTLMHIEPDIQEAHSLREWYDDIGNGMVFTRVFC